MRHTGWLLATATILLAPGRPAAAQQQGRVAPSGNGEAGERLTRDGKATGAAPLERINSRIQSRVQSRIRNRIDRFYDPQANAASPFAAASDQARTAGTVRR